MQPRYMGRIMNTYPVSEPEMEMLSSLSAQATVRYAAASLLVGLAATLWGSAIFTDHLNAAGMLAVKFIAPLLMFFAVCFFLGACWAQHKRKSKWDDLKKDSIPMQALAPVEIGR
jgi:hypothetical protein